MIFSTFNQLNCFLLFLFFGIVFGFIIQILFLVVLKKYQKNYLKIIFDGIFYSIFAIVYVILLNFYNFGEFSISLIFAYIIGFLWIKYVTKKIFAILENKWYTICKSKQKKEKTKHAKKHKAN